MTRQSSYREIIKTTSLFGGVQVFQIFIQIIKTKIAAILLGPTGIGIISLLTSTTGMISSITSFGLSTSGTKSIAEAIGSGDENRIEVIITVLRKCIWISGILGMATALILSPWLSQLTFNNKDYTFAFVWLSLTLILDQLSSGQLAILRGLRKYKYLLRASVLGSLFGLFISLPLYYFFSVHGIIPAIISSSVLNIILSLFFVQKLKISHVKIPKEITLTEGKIMLKMGFVISMSGMVTMGASYLIRLFISNYGGVGQVGLYSAGFTLINTYVGLFFSAMAADYFPRLSLRADDNNYCQNEINGQAEISFLLLTPLMVIFLIFCPLIIKLLFTSDFSSIDKMLYFSILGMLFRAASWSLSFVFIAKGHAKIFFYNEFIANIYILILNLSGYSLFGLTGIGIAFVLSYILYFIHMSILSYLLYKIKIENQTRKVFIIQFIFLLFAFLICFFLNNNYRFYLGIPILFSCFVYSYNVLNHRINISEIIRNFKNKNKN